MRSDDIHAKGSPSHSALRCATAALKSRHSYAALSLMLVVAMLPSCAYPEMKFVESGVGGKVNAAGRGNTGSAGTQAMSSAGTGTSMASAGKAEPANGGTTTGPLTDGGTAGSVASGQGGNTLADGGTQSSGGAENTAGGPNVRGGSGGGGAFSTGGRANIGGTFATGGNSVAGASSIGGSATGGKPPTGGVGPAGAPGSGGTSTGGAQAAGGIAATGGLAATGGIPTTGAPFVPTTPSCLATDTTCQGESCCTSIAMPGGTYKMGRSIVQGESDFYAGAANQAAEVPEHPATVSAFALDKYEVTVSRFRRFVDGYDPWHKDPAANPKSGVGANPNVDASIRAATAWGGSWTLAPANLPADFEALKTALQCDAGTTWKETADSNEAYPINCVNWYAAFAFCIWDGGWLPTEAEWEYAAAGGTLNRLFPWGPELPDANRASFSPSGSTTTAVGSKLTTGGVGAFGHADLAGSMEEWVFDWFLTSQYGTTTSPKLCNNCANTTAGTDRVTRGGSWVSSELILRAACRNVRGPVGRYSNLGFRCARAVPSSL